MAAQGGSPDLIPQNVLVLAAVFGGGGVAGFWLAARRDRREDDSVLFASLDADIAIWERRVERSPSDDERKKAQFPICQAEVRHGR